MVDLVVVANRLPVSVDVTEEQPRWTASPGGLVTALAPVFRERAGVWVGWPGGSVRPPQEHEGIALCAVAISDVEYEEFYDGFANGTLWPLYHDAIRPPAFHREWWHAYVMVNRRYAEAVAEVASPGAVVWIHDFHLQLVPAMVRALRADVRLGFFLHIPFPPRELFMQLPWRRDLVEGLLGADVVGFQTPNAAQNFARLARQLTSAVGTDSKLDFEGRSVRVAAYPISIDVPAVERLSADPHIQRNAEQLRDELGSPRTVILGVDRLDYTKGIGQRLRAVEELFAEGTLSTPEQVVVQVAVPSRETAPHYSDERDAIERLIGEINGTHSSVGHPAVHYLHRNLPFEELVGLYVASDVMLVTPFRDGMNLVAKEYIASRRETRGALVLSEFAGAAHELQAALIVNPHDLDGLKRSITHAVTMQPEETRARMRRLRRAVRRHDVQGWARSFLDELDR